MWVCPNCETAVSNTDLHCPCCGHFKGLSYQFDVVFCVAVSSEYFVDELINILPNFYQKLIGMAKKRHKHINNLNVKIITYGNYASKISESKFYKLPDESIFFTDMLKQIRCENKNTKYLHNLEVLKLAINSNWSKEGDRRRQIIVVFSDKPDKVNVQSLNNLTDFWENSGGLSKVGKKLIIFAPDVFPFQDMAINLNNCIHYPSETFATEISDEDYDSILYSAITAS